MRRSVRLALVVGVLVALAVGTWAWWRSPSSTTVASSHGSVASDASPPDAVPPGASDATALPSGAGPGRRSPTSDRDETRAKILQALARAHDDPPPHPAADPSKNPGDAADPTATPGTFTDRIGDRPYLTRVLSDEIMPLVDECVAQARERDAALGGMLAIELEIVADPEHGGIVETAGASDRNEVADPELVECVRESTLSAILPAPEDGGREALLITIPTDDGE
jgi:hypothetical protein